MTTKLNPFAVLGVDRSANKEQIKKAYYKCALKHHPDKVGENARARAEEIFKQVSEAYKILSDDTLRDEYEENAEDDDDIPLSNAAGYLNVGNTLSKEFKILLEKWKRESLSFNYIDNISTEVQKKLNEIISPAILASDKLHSSKKQIIQCDLCGMECENMETHLKESISAYNNLVGKTIQNSDLKAHIMKVFELFGGKEVVFEKVNFQSIGTIVDRLANSLKDAKIIARNFTQQMDGIDMDTIPNYLLWIKEKDEVSELLPKFINAIAEPNFDSITNQLNFDEIFQLIKRSEMSTGSEGLSSLFTSEANRRIAKGKYPLLKGGNKYFQNVPLIDIADPPSMVTANLRTHCRSCSVSFGLLKRKYNCRMCGEVYCKQCLLESPVPRFGYFFNVKVCKQCKRQMKVNDFDCWLEASKKCADFRESAKMIAITQCYSIPEVYSLKAYDELGKYFLDSGNANLAILCFQYAKLEESKWLKLLRLFFYAQNYKMAVTLVQKLKKLFNYDNNRWIQHGNYYFEKTQLKGLLKHILLSIFFYNLGGESKEKLCSKIIQVNNQNLQVVRDLLVHYVLFKFPGNLRELGFLSLNAKAFGLALFFFEKSGFLLRDWVNLVDTLCEKGEYCNGFQLWINIQRLVQNVKLSDVLQSSYTKYLHCIIEKRITIDNMYSNLSKHLFNHSPKELLLSVSFLIIIFKDRLLGYIEECFAKNEFEKLILFYKISQSLEITSGSWVDLGNRFLEKGYIEQAFQCFEYMQVIWKELGDDFFNKKRFTSALNCYLLSKDSRVDEQIFEKAKILVSNRNFPKAAIYLHQLIIRSSKLTKEIILFLGNFICANSVEFNYTLKNCVLTFLATSININNHEFVPLHVLIYHLLELEGSQKNLELVIGCLHIIGKQNNLTPQLSLKLKEYINLSQNHLSDSYYLLLQQNLYEGNSKDLALLINHLSIRQYKCVLAFYQSLVGDRGIEAHSEHYRCKLYIIRAAIYIYQEKFLEALNDLKESLLCFPVKELPEAVSIMFMSEPLQIGIYKQFLRRVISMNGSAQIDIKLPLEDRFQNLLKGSKMLTVIKKFERSILKRINNHEEAALLYMDLSMAVGDAAGLASCFLMSGYHFLVESQNSIENLCNVYAYRNGIFQMCVSAHEIANRYLTPPMQIHIDKQIFSLIINSNLLLIKSSHLNRHLYSQNYRYQTKLAIGNGENYLISKVFQNFVNLGKISPIIDLPVTLGCDTIYIDLACRSFLEPYLENLSRGGGSKLCPYELADYYLLESAWNHWFHNNNDDEGDYNFLKYREQSMLSLLKSQQRSLKEVEFLMDWPLFPRDRNGWIDPKNSKLQFCIESFRKFHGLQMNKSTGEISFLLENSSQNNGLFTYDDINTVFVLGIQSALFTLDQPDDLSRKYHPFQEMKYYPKQLSGSDYLATLLQTDYLLKMISMGVEVSSKAPFALRDITPKQNNGNNHNNQNYQNKYQQQGFLSRLPEYLREAIKPVHLRENCDSFGTAHRFWIEAGELLYDVDENDQYITWRFSDIKMKVKKHLLRYDENGLLVDDENNIDDDDSAEATFAANFTKYYDQIGAYFPEFLRLKELLKMGAAYTILQSLFKNIKKTIREFSFDRSIIANDLKNIRKGIKEFPINTESYVNELYYDLLKQNGLYDDSRVAPSEIYRAKENIRSQLRTAEHELISQITSILANGYYCNYYNIESLVSSWLEYPSYDNELINALAAGVKYYITNEKQKILNAINALNLKTEEDKTKVSLRNGEFSWVPAAYFNGNSLNGRNIKVYGGVNLSLNMRQGGVGGSSYNIYSSVVLNRMASVNKSDMGHKFPMSFDAHIINNGTVTSPPSRDGRPYQVYSLAGGLGGSQGTYTVGVRPVQTSSGNTINLITHRCFYSNK